MTEKEIREVIRELCEELDERARRMVKKVVLPTMLGAGLALSVGACGDRTAPGKQDVISAADMAYGVPLYMAPSDYRPADHFVGGPDMAYRAPDREPRLDGKPKPDLGPIPPYMAPMDGGASTLYSMPLPDSKTK
jgi:hypothetical protein